MLNIILSGPFVITYYNTTNDRYLKTPSGHFMVFSEPDNKLTIRHTINNSNFANNINVTDISTPAIGANTYEVYLEKLAQYMNGDASIVF